ncbi:uncharacterized protein [Physcomitrium patens]|uniref:Thylakoid soluble phosphoprotein TSP9 n=2 Tax=Physcomitrium patens TaxID=3218 RepID=A0A7I3YYL0_PHYPA|nr:uncharacterized protein LOC112293990 [Physcomitrium patens]XP_024399801.1 uncharacterized protein LOC112293990 [Physcomitrium patens]XP_024399802.1 uncharacterized protein LOC112293990 [Physcomitrium patens]|eukprot:XP_024399800.1 uncharacterized protein LOC112293990 [Physcomitrella patens]
MAARGWGVCGESQAPTRLSSESTTPRCTNAAFLLPLSTSSHSPRLSSFTECVPRPTLPRNPIPPPRPSPLTCSHRFYCSLPPAAAMAMTMGVTSLAVTAAPSPMISLRASAVNKGEKQGFLDWFRDALDKDALRETDDVLNKVDSGKSNGRPAVGANKGAAAPAPAPKKSGFNLFGKK